MITVAEMKGKWTTVTVGGAGIAAKFQQIRETWPPAEGYEFRFIRIYGAVQDLVEVSRQGDVLGYVSLSVLPGMEEVNNNGFDARMLYSESDFRGSLSDSVEASRRSGEEMEESPGMPVLQPGLSGTSGYSEQQELSTVSSLYTITIETLDVNEVSQKFSQWCWAACSKAILDYYDVMVTVNVPPSGNYERYELQCELADWAWKEYGYNYGSVCQVSSGKGFNKYGTNPDPDIWIGVDWNDANYMSSYSGSLEGILDDRGVNATASSSHLSFNSVKSKIDAGQPFVIRFGWIDSSGDWDGGHFMVGYGYNEIKNLYGNVVQQLVYYMNPWKDEGYTIALYNWTVYETYHHRWTSTLTTSY
ncbi:MAG: hypothetical protein GY940_29890 [bacterium]|nr:hypothetical protein [bacterium]